MGKLSKEIKTKVPAILTNLVLLFSVYIVSVILLPQLQGIGMSIQGIGIASGSLPAILLLVVGLYFGLKIFTDVLALTETASETFVDRFPWVNEDREADLRKAIKEVVAALLIILLIPTLAQMILLIPMIGPVIAQYIVLAIVVVIFFLLFDAGKILYVELSEWSQNVANVLAGEAEKFEVDTEKKKKERESKK